MEYVTRNIFSLKPLFLVTGRGGFNVGAFSPRHTPLIRPVLQAADYLQE
jgi:hypothetical protein